MAARGRYYLAMRETTPFASFLPLNGFIMVLANIDTGIRDQRTEQPPQQTVLRRERRDAIACIPPRRSSLYVLHLKKAGVSVDYHPQPLGEHNTAWWPDIRESFERFVADHPRDPSPARLTWATSNLKHNRAHWLVIDRLGAQPGDPRNLPDVNEFQSEPADGDAAVRAPRRLGPRRSGPQRQHRGGDDPRRRRVHAARLAGCVRSQQPIKVTSNGKVVFDGKIQPSVETLLKWAARDNDRTMLYAAEIPIKLGR